jgi:hypothetical protein
MSVSKIVAGVVALALGAVVVTALAGATPEEKTERPAVASKADQPETKASRLQTRTDRPESGANGARTLSFSCPKEPWPYGCQWREPPTRRVTRGSRPAG